MDTKTPEQLAADYATSQFPDEGPERAVWRMCRDDFLAAYEAAKPKWISVKEQLPRPGQEVLAFDDGILRVQSISSNGTWHPYLNGRKCNPTHWMPLPEAPKE